ncbi:shikimate dehydrogenase family protein [Alsobacter sp. SYSU BS001988]
MLQVKGTTRLFAIVADPVAHVKTPEIINARFDEKGLDGILVPLHVRTADLGTFFSAMRRLRNLEGWIVTVPHKTSALALCDEVSPQAERIGAVNCIRREPDGRLYGAMLDGIGFVDGLRGQGIEPADKAVHLVGAGGAAAAIAFALAESGVSRLVIANRSAARRDELLARLARHHPECRPTSDGRAAEADIVVNATSVGLRPGDGSPVPEDELRPEQIVAEVIMEPEITPLLRAAQAKGSRIHLGRHMLDAQAVAMIAHMTGEWAR